jgi:hypothetical protein
MSVNVRIILKWILKSERDSEVDSSGSGYGPVTGPCEHGNGPSGTIIGGMHLGLPNDYQLLRTLTHGMD